MQEFHLDTQLIALPEADHGFPRVLSLREDGPCIRLSLEVSTKLCWFQGHFPDQPVLPGVIQLHWAVLVAQALFRHTDVPTEIKRLKFKKIITPPQTLELSMSRQGLHEVQFSMRSADAQYSEGRLVFAEATSC